MKNLLFIVCLILAQSMLVAQNGKATTVKTKYHRETSVSIEISASESIIWSLLTNASDYTRWNSTVTSLEGKIALGEKIKLKSILDAKRTFKLKVKEFEVNKKMVWSDKQGSRVYTLSKLSNGNVLFSMSERIGGFMFPLYASKIPSFDETFEKFAFDLKRESELISKTK